MIRRRQAITLIIWAALLAWLPSAGAARPLAHPQIGLVLGGGGAKGGAHIGVLRVLDELRVPVDCVAGTSMGALVGATFAAGMPPEEIEAEVRNINWSRTVGSEGQRSRMPINRKLAGTTYTNNIEVGIKRGRLVGATGLFRTQDIEDLLRNLVADARFTRNFDELPIPFRAVATDMLTGRMVVLGKGDLAVAMRASMAVPGAFAPVALDGRLLADGSMVRNLPVDIARNLCADVVIAISLPSPPLKATDLSSAVSLAARVLDVSAIANESVQLATLTDRDVSIVVPMGEVGSTSFERLPDTIEMGRNAAMAAADQLRRYALPEAEYHAWRQRVTRMSASTTTLADVRISGLKEVNPEYVRSQLHTVQPGATVSNADIAEVTGRIYSLGDFERVDYQLTGPADARILDIQPVEKSWGPNFLRFDLGIAGGTGSSLQAVIRAEHRRTWLNPRGGVWHSAVQLGQDNLVETGLYQPLDIAQRFFVEPKLRQDSTIEDIYIDGERIARYDFRTRAAQLDLGANFGTTAQLRAGLRRGVVSIDRDTGPVWFPSIEGADVASLVLALVYDTRDAVALPTRGTLFNARLIDAGTWLGGEQEYGLIEGVLTRAFPWRGDSLSLKLSGGTRLSGTLPPNELFQLGGIRTFPGLQSGELRGERYWLVGADYAWKLADIQSLFGQALYAGLRMDAGRLAGRIDAMDDDVLRGIAATLSGRSPVGPFLISLGYVNNGSWQLQFAVGRPIVEGSLLDTTQ